MIQIELIKLATGARLLRLTEPTSGLALERTLDPKVPVSAQKVALAKVFQAALDQAQLAFACAGKHRESHGQTESRLSASYLSSLNASVAKGGK